MWMMIIFFNFQNCYCALSNIMYNSDMSARLSGEADAAGEWQMNEWFPSEQHIWSSGWLSMASFTSRVKVIAAN